VQEALGCSWFCEFESALVWVFKLFLGNSGFGRFVITDWGLAVNWSLGSRKNVYSLLCIFIIIIVVVIWLGITSTCPENRLLNRISILTFFCLGLKSQTSTVRF